MRGAGAGIGLAFVVGLLVVPGGAIATKPVLTILPTFAGPFCSDSFSFHTNSSSHQPPGSNYSLAAYFHNSTGVGNLSAALTWDFGGGSSSGFFRYYTPITAQFACTEEFNVTNTVVTTATANWTLAGFNLSATTSIPVGGNATLRGWLGGSLAGTVILGKVTNSQSFTTVRTLAFYNHRMAPNITFSKSGSSVALPLHVRGVTLTPGRWAISTWFTGEIWAWFSASNPAKIYVSASMTGTLHSFTIAPV